MNERNRIKVILMGMAITIGAYLCGIGAAGLDNNGNHTYYALALSAGIPIFTIGFACLMTWSKHFGVATTLTSEKENGK